MSIMSLIKTKEMKMKKLLISLALIAAAVSVIPMHAHADYDDFCGYGGRAVPFLNWGC